MERLKGPKPSFNPRTLLTVHTHTYINLAIISLAKKKKKSCMLPPKPTIYSYHEEIGREINLGLEFRRKKRDYQFSMGGSARYRAKRWRLNVGYIREAMEGKDGMYSNPCRVTVLSPTVSFEP